MGKVRTLMVMLLAFVFGVSSSFAAQKSFTAELSGKEEVPPVNTKASGKAEFKLSGDGKTLNYTLKVKDIVDPRTAHIHKGMKGENGPPVVTLLVAPKNEGTVGSSETEGVIGEKQLTGDLKGKTVADLVSLINSGKAYVNVHTDTNPNGEIRGQVK